MTVRVLVADDDELVRSGLAAILGAAEGLEVVATVADGDAAVRAATQLVPDVLVMDVRMPGTDGIEATRRLVQVGSAARILVVTTFEHDEYVTRALHVGAHGFLLKRAGGERLVQAVRALAGSDAVLFPESIRALVATGDPRRTPLPELSPRQAQVLRLMAQGRSNAEIAAALFLGVETVKTYVSAVLAELEVRDRTQAVVRAFESGFMDD